MKLLLAVATADALLFCWCYVLYTVAERANAKYIAVVGATGLGAAFFSILVLIGWLACEMVSR